MLYATWTPPFWFILRLLAGFHVHGSWEVSWELLFEWCCNDFCKILLPCNNVNFCDSEMHVLVGLMFYLNNKVWGQMLTLNIEVFGIKTNLTVKLNEWTKSCVWTFSSSSPLQSLWYDADSSVLGRAAVSEGFLKWSSHLQWSTQVCSKLNCIVNVTPQQMILFVGPSNICLD